MIFFVRWLVNYQNCSWLFTLSSNKSTSCSHSAFPSFRIKDPLDTGFNIQTTLLQLSIAQPWTWQWIKIFFTIYKLPGVGGDFFFFDVTYTKTCRISWSDTVCWTLINYVVFFRELPTFFHTSSRQFFLLFRPKVHLWVKNIQVEDTMVLILEDNGLDGI